MDDALHVFAFLLGLAGFCVLVLAIFDDDDFDNYDI